MRCPPQPQPQPQSLQQLQPEFPNHRDCVKCNRHEECRSPGIPSRVGDVEGGTPGGPALLVIGEQPGWHETQQGKCFVGRSGDYLKTVYLPLVVAHFDTIYYGNAIQCLHSRNIGVSHLAACRPYLMADILTILAAHGHLVILALGRYAAMSLLNRGVRDAFKLQGKPLPDRFWIGYPRRKKATAPEIAPDLLPDTIIPIFSTFHPAALMSGRNPSYSRSVFDHLSLLARSMDTSREDSHILAHVTWTRPGDTHSLPEPD